MTREGAHIILPGATLGIFGSGQLGRMLAMVAKRMGYRVEVFSPDANTPAGSVADAEHVASYDDTAAVRAFAKACDVITLEFENIPATAIEAAAAHAPVRPGFEALYTAQNRLREKTFFREQGIPTPTFEAIKHAADVSRAVAAVGLPAVMKTAGFGYDGKGQRVVKTLEAAEAAFAELASDCILEQFVDFDCEVSVVGVRGVEGAFTHFALAKNDHRNHILDVSQAPAAQPAAVAEKAVQLTEQIMRALDAVGVLCVEFFVTSEGEVLVNEMAPRTHNSGHLTIEACDMSQFEAQLRAVCGLPLLTPRQRPAAMVNLLGDEWAGGEPDWAALLQENDTFLHLYGKAEARPGRKMGHITVLAETPELAAKRALQIRERLTAP